MGVETSRGRNLMPNLRKKTSDLLSLVSRCMIRILHLRVHLDPWLVAEVFMVQENSLDVMSGIEEYMMQSKASLFFNSDVKHWKKQWTISAVK